ncbi:MAG: Hsp20/alpha crystallin family protein [bacterium]
MEEKTMAEKTIPTTAPTTAHGAEKAGVTREETRQEERYLVPPVDIYETTEGLTVVADLPGVGKDDVSIRIDDSILTIEGKTRHSAPGNPVYTEYSLLSYFRQFQLGEAVNQEKISADLKNGTLIVYLPKAEKAKPKQIKVNVA